MFLIQAPIRSAIIFMRRGKSFTCVLVKCKRKLQLLPLGFRAAKAGAFAYCGAAKAGAFAYCGRAKAGAFAYLGEGQKLELSLTLAEAGGLAYDLKLLR